MCHGASCLQANDAEDVKERSIEEERRREEGRSNYGGYHYLKEKGGFLPELQGQQQCKVLAKSQEHNPGQGPLHRGMGSS